MPILHPHNPRKSLKPNFKEPSSRPSYLRKRILAGFVVIFIAIIVALEVLYQSSESRNGIAASIESRHYLWTYGPTAILTVVATIWARVEFQAKHTAPWFAMNQSPQPADKSVLLDYISDMQPVAIWKALKYKHFAVASSVTCSLLLRLLIIFSTSLFSLKGVKVQKDNISIQLRDHFTAQDSTLKSVGSQPFDILNGVIYQNVTYPIGTNLNLTFQEFSAPTAPNGAIVIAPIDGLMADLDCETAKIDVETLHYLQSKNTSGFADDAFQFHIASKSCNITHSSALIASAYRQKAYFQGGYCERSIGPDGYRIILTLTEAYKERSVSAKPPFNHLHDGSGDWETIYLGLNKSRSLICKPTLSLLNLQAKTNTTQPSSNVHIHNVGAQSDGLPGISSTEIAQFAVNNSTLTTGFRPVEYQTPYETDAHVDPEFTLGMNLIGVDVNIQSLWDEGVIENSASAYYRAITAQILHMAFVKNTGSKTIGSAIVEENRVVMIELPLRGMEACLALSILLVISLIVLLPSTPATTWNPSFISTIAAITANSTAFRSSLHGKGLLTNEILQARLVGKLYYSQPTPKGTSIELTDDGRRESHFDNSTETEYLAWRPFPGIVGRVIIFILISLAIAVLEILLHLSQKHDGLGNAPSADKDLHYAWTILPALTMIGISLLLGSIDFNIRCLAPYAPLTRPKGALFNRSLNLSFLDSLGIINSFRSMTSRHFAVQATTLATSAAFFLTIVTSGLYSVMEIPYHTDVNFTQIGGFPDPRTIAGAKLNMDEAGETAGILTAQYILGNNLTFPQWSYEDLAFAEVAMDNLPNGKPANGSFVNTRIPALRLAPYCKVQTAIDLVPMLSRSVQGKSQSYQLWANKTKMACPGVSTDSSLNGSVSVWEDIGIEPFGYSTQGSCYTGPGYQDVFAGSAHYTESYIWGYLNGSSIEHIKGLSCIQYAETIEVKARLRLPDLKFDENYPPVPDESTAKLAPDLYVPTPEWWVINGNGNYPKFDGFFQLLTSGRYAIPVENFKSAEHDQIVIDAIKRQHKIISAQQMNNYTRGTSNDSVYHAPVLGSTTTSTHLRVLQDVISTRILEGLLAFILSLGILGSVLLNTDHVLPKNPCSIAAVASLLADSSLLDDFHRGEWNPDDKQLNQVFSDYRFHLGWWENSKERSIGTQGKVFTIDHRSAQTKESNG